MYKTILLAVDLNQDSSWAKALPMALGHCHAFGAALHVMTVVPDMGMAIVGSFFPSDFEEKAVARATEELHALTAKHVPAGTKVHHTVARGSIYREILSAAGQIGADLIIMSARRLELEDYLLGPNAARVVRHADCSVLVVRD
jgi:nucleotide-binding universal stress UspA family protein